MISYRLPPRPGCLSIIRAAQEGSSELGLRSICSRDVKSLAVPALLLHDKRSEQPLDSWPSNPEISSGSLGSRKRPSHEIQLLAIPQRQYPVHNFTGLPQIQLRNASSAGTPTLPRLGLCHRGSHLTSARLPFHLHNSFYRHSPVGLASLSTPRLPNPIVSIRRH